MQTFRKYQEETLDYDIVMSDWLGDDRISGCSVSHPDEISLDSKAIYDERVKLWLSGGTSDKEYMFECLVTTIMGRQKNIQFKLKVR